jgi:hypothetical protein
METKQHILSTTLKVLMHQIRFIITKKGNRFDVRPIMCTSFINEGKTQLRWAATVMDQLQTSGKLQDKTSFIDPSTGVDLLKSCSPDYFLL